MREFLFLLLCFVALFCFKLNANSYYYISGVSNPVINLNGIWKVNINPSEKFWDPDKLSEDWKDVVVPGECMMQGIPIKHDQPFVYKKSLDIPIDFNNKQIVLQFDGVYSYARVWINDNYIRSHSGGFTRWMCDITPFVKAGEPAILYVEVTDKADEISYASGYAKHPIGGILRDVKLLALPINHPEDITIKTTLDENYQNGSLIISGQTKNISNNSNIKIQLFDTDHKKIDIKNETVNLENAQSFQLINFIDNPKKWDAEHPNLYSLRVSFSENEKVLWEKEYDFGFRSVSIKENKLLVNGKEVKLRGANRHDIHPLLGRISTAEYELKDVLLAKEANINFIRTSHYPPTENFLQLCDKYGIYVECETAVCFISENRLEGYMPGNSENNPAFTERYLSQLREMVITHKNNPSIIMWSIGNESNFGENFKKSYNYVKATDDTRPVIFSYPGNVPDSIKAYDILSMHYPDHTGSREKFGKETTGFSYNEMPVLFDEWAHVPCYNNFTIKEDPNIRDFWGISLDSMWQRTFDADGGLGGAIWAMIDETFMLPESLPGFNEWWGKIKKKSYPAEYSGHTIGYGEWGIIDTWRRKKPEFWNTKKAYSPVRLLNTKIENYSPDIPVSIPIYNRFDHTNINELNIKLIYKGIERILHSPDIQPHTKGELLFSMEDWEDKEEVMLEFYDNANLIDKYTVSLNLPEKIKDNNVLSEAIQIKEDEKSLAIVCENNSAILFDKTTGQLKEIQNSLGTFSISGPKINLRTRGELIIKSYHQINEYCTNWQLTSFNYEQKDKEVVIEIKGKYDNVFPAEFILVINQIGEIKIQYKIENLPNEYIRELGIKFEAADNFDSLSWGRNTYWSYYPADHLSAKRGKTALYNNEIQTYRMKTEKDWNLDSKSFYYNGTVDENIKEQLTNISKATKENITEYNLHRNGNKIVSILNDNNSVNCRLSKADKKVNLFASNKKDYPDLNWGNYQRNIIFENYSDKINLKIYCYSEP